MRVFQCRGIYKLCNNYDFISFEPLHVSRSSTSSRVRTYTQPINSNRYQRCLALFPKDLEPNYQITTLDSGRVAEATPKRMSSLDKTPIQRPSLKFLNARQCSGPSAQWNTDRQRPVFDHEYSGLGCAQVSRLPQGFFKKTVFGKGFSPTVYL